MDDPIVIETDLFEHREVRPHFINPCCFGEDFAEWLRRQLSHSPDLDLRISDPIQEDYGWGLWATRDEEDYWIAISCVGNGPGEAPAEWVISITYDRWRHVLKHLLHKPNLQTLAQLRDRVHQILASNQAIKTISKPSELAPRYDGN